MSFHLMCSNLTNLKSLTVINCQKLYNYMPLGECKQLERLMVGQTFQICDDDLTTVAANHTLRSLNIVKCLNITTDGIVHLVRNCPINEVQTNNILGGIQKFKCWPKMPYLIVVRATFEGRDWKLRAHFALLGRPPRYKYDQSVYIISAARYIPAVSAGNH